MLSKKEQNLPYPMVLKGIWLFLKKDSIQKKRTNILSGKDKEYMLLSIFSLLQFRIKKKKAHVPLSLSFNIGTGYRFTNKHLLSTLS